MPMQMGTTPVGLGHLARHGAAPVSPLGVLRESAALITTARLTLRPFVEADFDLYAEANANPEVMRFLGGPIDRATSDRQAEGANRSLAEHGYGKVAIERCSDGAFLGMCGLSREPWYPNDLELGWRLLPNYVGSGYATEAGLAWLSYAFSTLRASRIISIADASNSRSIAVMQRLGMTLDHTAELSDGDDVFSAAIYSTAGLSVQM